MMRRLKIWQALMGLIVILYITVGLAQASYKGTTWDEIPEYIGLLQQFFMIKEILAGHEFSYTDLSLDYSMYGIGFKSAAYLLGKYLGNNDVSSYLYYSHILSSLLSLLPILAVYKLGITFAVPAHAVYSMLLLAIMPSWLGHSFFNNKDIPFGTFYSISTFAGMMYIYSIKSCYRVLLSKSGGVVLVRPYTPMT